MELNYAEVGGRVRDLRRARHLTQEALAEGLVTVAGRRIGVPGTAGHSGALLSSIVQDA